MKVKVQDFVKKTFLKLTSTTVPYGYEDKLVEAMRDLFPEGLKKDTWGNYVYTIGESRTIFAAHLDTVSKDFVKVKHIIDGNIIRTDGKTTLGADDKAGITVMLWMIKNEVPGNYYFFIGEEVGCIGSGDAAKLGEFRGKYDRIISFDRRDVGSIITYQSSSRCCSDEFADALCRELNWSKNLNYSKDTGGVYTDSAEFTHLIAECTNVSVGYYKEHTTSEHQNIQHLSDLAEACCQVNWENLPTKRDPNQVESSHYGYGNSNWKKEHNTSNWRSRDFDYHDDWYESDYGQYSEGSYFKDSIGYGDSMSDLQPNRGKKRRKRNKEKRYISNGGELQELKDNSYVSLQAGDKYDWIINKFLESDLEYWELQFIKENYLDMKSDYDKYFYEYLLDELYAKNSYDY